MNNHLNEHPILSPKEGKSVNFTFNGITCKGFENEMISSALISNGITTFGHHPKDNSPQGIFCANGQCSRCNVICDDKIVKSCITPLKENMVISTVEGKPEISKNIDEFKQIENISTDVLIIGGGPSGLTAAIELGKLNINTILIDDKDRLGGKLVLQTHNFFGSIDDCYAGTRGVDIATKLENELKKYSSVKVFLNTTAVGVFSDKKVGMFKDNNQYIIVTPKTLLVTTGAREKTIPFKNAQLPGVFGAGAFQTLLNRDLVKPSQRIFIIGGGNVGLIAAYHALQGNITVVGLCEGLKKVGGYKVHLDKIKRLGVPVYLQHSIISANGEEKVESVTIGQLDDNWNIIKGTEKTFECDTILVAVGLEKINQFKIEAEKFNMKVFSAGDANEIAEASSAMLGGKVVGLEIAKSLGFDVEISDSLNETANILKSHPGDEIETPNIPQINKIYPVIHCLQEIPCNPCVSVCSKGSIKLAKKKNSILDIPTFEGECFNCGKCVAVCPGLAITIIDTKKDGKFSEVTIPFEFIPKFKEGDFIPLVDINGVYVDDCEVIKIKKIKAFDRRLLILLKVKKEFANKVVSTPVQNIEEMKKTIENPIDELIPDDFIICHCERVTAGEIREYIKQGIKDFNALKTIRVGMGACGGKTCSNMVERLFKEAKINDVTKNTNRPLSIEVPLGAFAKK